MKFLLPTCLVLCTLSSSLFGQTIKIKVENQKDSTVFLVKYYGKNLLYADTAQMKNGVVTFDGRKQKQGMVGLLLPGQKFFEFLYDGKDIDLTTKGPDYSANLKVNKSDDNKMFLEYIRYLNEEKKKAEELVSKAKGIDKNSSEYKKYEEQIDAISDAVRNYQTNFAQKNKDRLAGKIVKMSTDIKVPELPRNDKGEILDSNFRYYYLRDHYFDNIDVKDDRLVNTPIFDQKIQYFFGDKFLLQVPDTIFKFAEKLLDRMDPHSEMLKYTLTQIMVNSEKSNIMGMDKLTILLGEKYYCNNAPDGKPYVDWMDKDKLDDLCKRVEIGKHLTIGSKAINITLTDSTQKNWRDFYSLKSDYTILYFWEATCGHCKLSTPLLETLYEKKLKNRNVEVFAISKAIGEDFETWKKFIRDNHLTFINVGLTDSIYKIATSDARQLIPKYTNLQSLNFQDTYDIFSTPRVFVLDKDKKIIAKRLSISQLEDFLDRVQNIENPKKIIPEDSKQ